EPLGARYPSLGLVFAVRFFRRLVDRVHAVIAADREEVRIAAVHLVEHLHELDIEGGVALVVIVPRRNETEAGVAHRLERLLRRRLARPQDFGLAKIDSPPGERLAQRCPPRAPPHPDADPL